MKNKRTEKFDGVPRHILRPTVFHSAPLPSPKVPFGTNQIIEKYFKAEQLHGNPKNTNSWKKKTTSSKHPFPFIES